MAAEKKNITRQVYNASDDVNVLADIDRVSCILYRRGMATAAFNAAGEFLSYQFVGYNREKIAWDLDFFEQLFNSEPLLRDTSKVTRVYFFSPLHLIVPAELYDEAEATRWLQQVHFIDANDVIKQYYLREDKAHYLYSVPLNIEALIKINCSTAAILPLSAYQFSNNYTRGVRVHCFLTNDHACVSLYHYGTLLWHRIFDYNTPEDIAYEIRLICEEHKINADKITIACNAISAAEYKVINGLSQYFSGITTGSGIEIEHLWSPALSLVKQLDSCA